MMINRSPSMALCLKFFSNKLTNARTLALKRKLGTPPVEQPCSFLQEFVGAKNGVSPVIAWSWEGQARSSSTISPTVNSTDRKRYRFSDYHQQSRVHVPSVRNQEMICLPYKKNRRSLDRYNTSVDSSLCLGAKPCVSTADDICLEESCCTTVSHPVVWNVESDVVYEDIEKQMLLLSSKSKGKPLFTLKPEFVSGDPSQPPNEDQLERVRSILENDLNMFFVCTLNYRIYHPEIIFENNIQGERTEGILPYVKKASWLRTVGHIRYIYIKFEVMKITAHPEDGCVRVRWRIRGIKAYKILKFWTFKLWDWQSMFDHLETWHEGFSTFHVLGDGLIHKHVADKRIPDQDTPTKAPEKEKKIESVPAALFLPLSQFHALSKFLDHFKVHHHK